MMQNPQRKRGKLYIILMIIGVILLIVGLPLSVFAEDVFGGKIPEEKTLEETELVSSCNTTAEYIPPNRGDQHYLGILAGRSGSRIVIHIYDVSNGTIDVWLIGSYFADDEVAGDYLFAKNDTTYAYIDIVVPKDYISVDLYCKNYDFFAGRDYTMDGEVYATITKDNYDDVQKARTERSRIGGIYAVIFLVVSLIGFLMLLAGAGFWLRARKRFPQAPAPPPTPLPVAPAPAKCPHCGSAVEKGWKACPACGSKLPLLCPHCGAVIQEGWKACPSCGEKI